MAAIGPLTLAGCGGDLKTAPPAPDAPSLPPVPAPAPNAVIIPPADVPAEQLPPQPETPASAPAEVAAPVAAFVHPGLLHTDADFTRMREKVAANVEPWASGWTKLLQTGRSHLGNNPRPLERVVRGGDGSNVGQMFVDVARAYQIALRWKISGDAAYAEKAIAYLNAWSSTMKELTGNADRFLAAGIYGYQFANAGEIMRTYDGWAKADMKRFQDLLLNVFYPMNRHFLQVHNGAHITNYWANWDQCNLAAMLAIGVFCDRRDIYDDALNYYKTGPGNGASTQAVYYIHPGYLGQWQESGRDQGHTTLGIGLAGAFCEMAWNQGDDMYGLNNNRLLAGAEYVAKSNLRDASNNFYSLPFAPYRNSHSYHDGVSPAALGIQRPVWELVYHHYVNRKGLAAPYTALMAAQVRAEGDGGNGDQQGLGTLTCTRDPIAPGRAPSGLSAQWSGGKMVLSWWGSAHASSYNVKRGTRSGGPYTTIATGISDLLTYSDAAMTNGTHFYVVTAQSAVGESAPCPEVRAVAGTLIHTRLSMNEEAGTTAADASGNGHTGTVAGGAAWVAGRTGNALALDGVDDYVSLPPNVVADLADFTIAAWVFWDSSRTWARVFDFGSGTGHYMMLTPRSGGGVVRFGITVNHGIGEQGISGTAPLPTGQWVHVAVTLSGATGNLYVNGVLVGTNTNLSHAPFRLGPTNQNWIGRSQFDSDPFFNGKIDDFRIYRGALSDAEVLSLKNDQLSWATQAKRVLSRITGR